MSVVVNDFEVVPAAAASGPAEPAPASASTQPPSWLPAEVQRLNQHVAERAERLEAH